MAVLPTALNLLGIVFLSHAVYSSHEHSLLTPPQPLPLDITLETLFSVLLLCVGVVLSSQDLRPIRWSVWAGRLEKDKGARVIKEVGGVGGNPYSGLEERQGFWDVRGGRRGFEGWVREGGVVL